MAATEPDLDEVLREQLVDDLAKRIAAAKRRVRTRPKRPLPVSAVYLNDETERRVRPRLAALAARDARWGFR